MVFQWESVQQKAYDEIKGQLQKPPILYMPDNKKGFHLLLYYAIGPLMQCSVCFQIALILHLGTCLY